MFYSLEFIFKTNILAIWVWKSVDDTPYATACDDTSFARSKFAMVPQHKLAISGVPIGKIPVSNLCHGQNVLSVHSLARARTVSYRIKSYLIKNNTHYL